MIWKVTQKEFLLNLMTFKFVVCTVLCVVLTGVFTAILLHNYQQRLKDYNQSIANNMVELRKVKVYKNITPTIYRPPEVLSVFSEGLEKRLSNSAKIELRRVPKIDAISTEFSPYLSIFPILDISVIFKIVMSILALLVAYDVISGEREQGTLKLMLSNTVGRYQVLLGKLLAGLITLVIPTTIAFIVVLLIFEFSPMVKLSGSDWACIGLMYSASLIFISAMYNISLLFSCLTRRSAISLVFGLFFWIVCVVMIPNGSVYLSKRIHPLESDEKIKRQHLVVLEKFNSELEEINKKLPPGGAQLDADGAFGQWYALVCDEHKMEHWKKRSILEEPLKIKYADKLSKVDRHYASSLSKQTYLTKNLSRTSPISLYENIMSALSGTDLEGSQYFIDNAKAYRNKVIEYIRSKTDNFSSLSYFTPSVEGDWIEYQKGMAPFMKDMEAGKENVMDAFMKWVKEQAAKTPSLDFQDFPQFVHQPDVVKNLERAIPDFVLLLLINSLFFVLSFVAFLKYDIR